MNEFQAPPQPCWHYAFAGLRIRSALCIPEWAVFAMTGGSETPDVCIDLADAGRWPAADEPAITATEYRFRVAGVGDYWVRRGREILIAPAPRAASGEWRLFLLGTAWGALCYQRGLLCLHASAVQFGDAAFAFSGASGAGKSSMVAWLLQRGGCFVADDLCRSEIDQAGQPVVHVAAPRVKLWTDGLVQLGMRPDVVQQDQSRHDKWHVTASMAIARQPVLLRAICLLAWGEVGLTRLRGKAALSRVLAAATYRPYLLEPMGITASHWQRCLELVQRVPVFELRRPKNWADMDRAMNLLIEQSLGACPSKAGHAPSRPASPAKRE